MRLFSVLLSLPLLIACGKVVDPTPNSATAGATIESPAGRGSTIEPASTAGTAVDPGEGGAGGSTAGRRAIPPTKTSDVDAGDFELDAGTAPPKPDPAADGGKPDTGTSRDALCDGSQEMRFTFATSGGFVWESYSFTNQYGLTFLLIDGSCRYFAGENYMLGIISGTLTQAEADELSNDVHWNELSGWGDWGTRKDAPCPDSGLVSLSRSNVVAACSCGCDPTAPKGLADALAKSYAWVQRLMTQGKPLDGPVSAIAMPTSSGSSTTAPTTWPLTRSMSSIANLFYEQGDARLQTGTGPYARFDDPAEATKLREVRAAHAKATTLSARVQEASTQYDLFVRDELPEDAVRALKAFQATIPTQ